LFERRTVSWVSLDINKFTININTNVSKFIPAFVKSHKESLIKIEGECLVQGFTLVFDQNCFFVFLFFFSKALLLFFQQKKTNFFILFVFVLSQKKRALLSIFSTEA